MSGNTKPLAGSDWQGPGAPQSRQNYRAVQLIWALVFPLKRHQIAPTVLGLVLIALAMGIGTAAYNTGSNILFLTLALLLACLLLSGLLSWFNFRGICWRFRRLGPWRVGHDALVILEVQNRKSWLSTYGLWFDLVTHPLEASSVEPAAPVLSVRAGLAASEQCITRGRLFQRDRLLGGGNTAIEWGLQPQQRGAALVAVSAVGSLYPFGFLKKSLGAFRSERVLVWPAQIAYAWVGAAGTRVGGTGQRTVRAGSGEDLRALRKYNPGDSQRLIHWKASARLGQLMLRQFSAESQPGYVLKLEPGASHWSQPEQFERLCSFAATLAEDLFATGRLRAVALADSPPQEIRRLHELEGFLDQLALLKLSADAVPAGVGPPRRAFGNIITFSPTGTHGVNASLDGQIIATA